MNRPLRISDARRAVGTSKKLVSNWIQRGKVTLWSPAPERWGWRTFSAIDLLHLVFVRSISRHGVPVALADVISREFLAPHFVEDISADVLTARVLDASRGLVLVLSFRPPCSYRDKGAWEYRYSNVGEVIALPSAVTVILLDNVFASFSLSAAPRAKLEVSA